METIVSKNMPTLRVCEGIFGIRDLTKLNILTGSGIFSPFCREFGKSSRIKYYRSFSVTWSAALQIAWNKIKF